MMVLTFTVTPQAFSAVMEKLKADGATITESSANEFVMQGHGVKADVKYSDPTLTVSVLAKPFYVSEAMISSDISKALTELTK